VTRAANEKSSPAVDLSNAQRVAGAAWPNIAKCFDEANEKPLRQTLETFAECRTLSASTRVILSNVDPDTTGIADGWTYTAQVLPARHFSFTADIDEEALECIRDDDVDALRVVADLTRAARTAALRYIIEDVLPAHAGVSAKKGLTEDALRDAVELIAGSFNTPPRATECCALIRAKPKLDDADTAPLRKGLSGGDLIGVDAAAFPDHVECIVIRAGRGDVIFHEMIPLELRWELRGAGGITIETHQRFVVAAGRPGHTSVVIITSS
jgi:hypothetical protein